MTLTSSGTPRVVIVTNTPVPYRVPTLRRVAEQNDIDLEVIYCAPPHVDQTLGAAAHGFEPYFLQGRYLALEKRFLHADLSILPLLDRLRPDVVITTGFIPTFLFAFGWAVRRGAAHVAMTDGTVLSERNLTKLHRWVRRRVFKRSHAFVGASEGSLDLFRSYGVSEDTLHRSSLCVNNAIFDVPRTADAADFIFCGRFVEHKRPIFAMQVALRVAEKLERKTTIDFVGQGVLEPEMRAYAASISNYVDVRFRGYVAQSDLPARYAAARIFLFPSEWDPWGLVANEACAAGLPVIISPQAGAAGELVQDGVNGYILPLDADAWANAAIYLLGYEILYQSFSERARELVAAFNFDEAAAGLAAAIRQAVLHSSVRNRSGSKLKSLPFSS